MNVRLSPLHHQLSDALSEFVTEKEKEGFLRELTATEDWLYDEGEDQSKKVYVKRLDELKKTGNKVVTREVEWRERPRAFGELASTIIHFEKILAEYKDEVRERESSEIGGNILSVFPSRQMKRTGISRRER